MLVSHSMAYLSFRSRDHCNIISYLNLMDGYIVIKVGLNPHSFALIVPAPISMT